jgi:hypothetical protein
MIVFAFLGLMVVTAVVLLCGARQWRLTTDQLGTKLEAARRPIRIKVYSASELIGLPASVQPYRRAAIQDGQPMVAAVSMEHRGTINMGETGRPHRTGVIPQLLRVIVQTEGAKPRLSLVTESLVSGESS